MLLFFVTFRHRYTLAHYFRTWGEPLLDRIGITFYEELVQADHVPAASAYVFADLERLTPLQLDVACDAAEAVEPARILNDPFAIRFAKWLRPRPEPFSFVLSEGTSPARICALSPCGRGLLSHSTTSVG